MSEEEMFSPAPRGLPNEPAANNVIAAGERVFRQSSAK
ncbi:MAG: hypothetical protein AVDCRST_MAG74-2635 [uncultured Pyrinomonadaceae bacterium]|uniref:Uncharacterized protein n=1 Tax=uncultured Pyrinomonadaceae bacterium TaxID=2283094 RepID=A0A6J4PIJ5_9BACT|nr:MAG: hypothetical protein AVDCRST_MAG74-2635 [uncultured Pyrinomonadaceae bacterium]